MTDVVLHGGGNLSSATMVDLIATAYSIADRDVVAGGPGCFERNRFDVAARRRREQSPADVRRMLQNLLADRCKLVARQDACPMTGYFLRV